MYKVRYSTLNDTYVKSFKSLEEAEKFVSLIKRLYPEQDPKVQ
jgi:hypothetical protein